MLAGGSIILGWGQGQRTSSSGSASLGALGAVVAGAREEELLTPAQSGQCEKGLHLGFEHLPLSFQQE